MSPSVVILNFRIISNYLKTNFSQHFETVLLLWYYIRWWMSFTCVCVSVACCVFNCELNIENAGLNVGFVDTDLTRFIFQMCEHVDVWRCCLNDCLPCENLVQTLQYYFYNLQTKPTLRKHTEIKHTNNRGKKHRTTITWKMIPISTWWYEVKLLPKPVEMKNTSKRDKKNG